MRDQALSRDEVVGRLDAGWSQGLMSLDTFEQRVARAYAARTADELADLLADLVIRPLAAPMTWLRETVRRRRSAPSFRVPVLLPSPDRLPLVVGRDPSRCEVVLPDAAVSRRHLELRAVDAGWTARDLGSTNGTWLGNARLGRARVDPGDELEVGETVLRLIG